MSVWSPEAASARPAASAASVRTSSSGAQTADWPLPPLRPHAAPTSAAARRHAGAAAPTAGVHLDHGRAHSPLMVLGATVRPAATLLRQVDPDAVGEGETTRHDLGRLGLAVHEADPAHVARVVAGSDAACCDHDADVREIEGAVGRDAEPERRPGGERLGPEDRRPAAGCSTVATERPFGVVLVDHAGEHARHVPAVLRCRHDGVGRGERPCLRVDERRLVDVVGHRRAGAILLAAAALGVG